MTGSGRTGSLGEWDPLTRGRLVAKVLQGSWRTHPPPPDITGEELSSIAPVLARQGSAGLAWARIQGTALEEAPGAETLRDGFRHHTLHVRVLEHLLPQAVEYYRARGVEVVLAKGWSVGRLYPEPGRRPYGDLDFLVSPAQLPRAERALRAPQAPKVATELHPGFNELRDRPVRELLGRARRETLHGVEIPVLAQEDHLRLLALHGLEHGLARPLWLCDLGALLESLPPGFDWELCMRGDAWLSEGTRCALGLAGELLGVELEKAGVPAQWREPPLPSWLVGAALRAFGARAHYMDLADLGQLLRHPGTLLYAARLRWANAIEATFRTGAPWDELPRLPVQTVDYLLRGIGFLGNLPGYLLRAHAP